MRQQQWRMFGLGMAAVFGVCVGHIAPAAAQDDGRPEAPPPRVKVQGGPVKKGRKPPTAADAAYEASKRAYEGLPLADRKAVQDALVWVAGYKGTLDGAFGKRTREALIAFETHTAGFNSDGIIDRAEFAALTAAAGVAKQGVRFTVVADKGAGIALGLPLKLLTKRTAVPGGTRYASADDGFVVETRAKPASEGDIATLYDKLNADSDDRTVTYKASKSYWFVVSGETGKDEETHFYTRFEQDPRSATSGLRGYTIFYDGKRSAEFDRLAIAVANSVEPFPSDATLATLPSVDTEAAPRKAEAPPPPPAPEPPRPRLTATAVVVAPGKAVSVLPEACVSPTAGKQALKVASRDAASGLTILDGVGGQPVGAAVREPAIATGDSLVVVGFASTDEPAVLSVASGEVMASGAEPRILAPLQDNASGSAVFDRNGAFRGIVGRTASKPRLVAGIVPQASHPLLLAAALARALPDAAPAAAGGDGRKRMAGEIAATAAGSLIAIDCVR